MSVNILESKVVECFFCRNREKPLSFTIKLDMFNYNKNGVKVCAECCFIYIKSIMKPKKGYHFCKICLKYIHSGRKEKHYQTKTHAKNLMRLIDLEKNGEKNGEKNIL